MHRSTCSLGSGLGQAYYVMERSQSTTMPLQHTVLRTAIGPCLASGIGSGRLGSSTDATILCAGITEAARMNSSTGWELKSTGERLASELAAKNCCKSNTQQVACPFFGGSDEQLWSSRLGSWRLSNPCHRSRAPPQCSGRSVARQGTRPRTLGYFEIPHCQGMMDAGVSVFSTKPWRSQLSVQR